jgi:hypothetical protein
MLLQTVAIGKSYGAATPLPAASPAPTPSAAAASPSKPSGVTPRHHTSGIFD